MYKYILFLSALIFISCRQTKTLKAREYFTQGYSLDFQYSTDSKGYVFQNSELGKSALIPQIDSISFANNVLKIKGYITNPPFQKLGDFLRVDSVCILYAKKKGDVNVYELVDSLGFSHSGGRIDIRIQRPPKKFELMFMKDSLIPCSLRFVFGKKAKSRA